MWAWILTQLTTFIGSSVARYLAMKAVIVALMMVTLPIIINNIIYEVMGYGMDLVGENSGEVTSWVGAFSGLTAYILSHIQAPEVLSIIMAAVATRYALGLIPFIRA